MCDVWCLVCPTLFYNYAHCSHGKLPEAMCDAPRSGYRVLDRAAAARLQQEAMEGVGRLVGCAASTARLLLMHFRWDRQRVQNALIAHGLAGLYVAAGIAAAPPVHRRQAAPVPGPGLWAQLCALRLAAGLAVR
ncbi:RBR-type E3 ubiquitin transferase, partial [Haematococcus lacustris]